MLSRTDLVLKYIVEYFIKTATPVGSNTLLENFDLDYSSATIRNEMAHLETLGYIEKTHTASGRVPTSEGYRYYVKYLRDKEYGVDENLKNQIATIISNRAKSVEEVVQESSEILSHMTNLASVVLGPSASLEHLVSIQILPLNDNMATCLFVTDKGYVENKTFQFEKNISIDDVKKCVGLINDRLQGTAINELNDKMEAIKPLILQMVNSNDRLFRLIEEAFVKFANERIQLYGRENLLEQPEFNTDLQKFKDTMRLISSPKKLKEVIQDDKDDELSLRIGIDEEGNGLDDVSFITRKIKVGNTKEGTITLVGPSRMDYDKVVNALDYIADQIDSLYSSEERNDDER